MRHFARFAFLAALCILPCGCAQMLESAREMGRQTKRTFTFRPGDYRDLTEEVTDDWTDDVGREGRGNQPIVKDPDQWWRTMFMSEKARSIERNVGIQ